MDTSGRLTKLLSLDADQLVTCKIGPEKSFARALDKVRTKIKEATAAGGKEGDLPGANTLKDLNRCTFVFDSPAVLALAVLLLTKKVRELKGTMERCTNFFYPNLHPESDSSDGKTAKRNAQLRAAHALAHEFESPPCVHCNFKVDGWVYEVMFSLEDFASTKRVIHKYYEIQRCKTESGAVHVDELLKPVFPVES